MLSLEKQYAIFRNLFDYFMIDSFFGLKIEKCVNNYNNNCIYLNKYF